MFNLRRKDKAKQVLYQKVDTNFYTTKVIKTKAPFIA